MSSLMLIIIGLFGIVWVLTNLLWSFGTRLFVSCKVSSFLIGFKKIIIIVLHKRCFWVKHVLKNYLWNYVFLKSIVL